MKVIMVTPSFYPITGGVEAIVRDFAIELNKIGVDTDVMTFNMTQKWRPLCKTSVVKFYNFKLIRISALNWFPLTHSDRITFRINLMPGKFQHYFKEYDIIHFHDGDDLTFPLFSYFIKKPKLLHLHGFTDLYINNALMRRLLKCLADSYISISATVKSGLIKAGIPEYKIRVIPNGIDTNLFKPEGKKMDNLLIFVGRIDPIKGLHVLLNALLYLKQPVHLIIIGPASQEDPYFKRILSMINKIKKGKKHRITYLGNVERKKLPKYYQRASIHIRSDIYGLGGGGITVLESFACETPVISTGNEIVKDGFNGLVVPPRNPLRLAQAIQYLLENKYARRKFGELGRKWVLENFSLNVVVRKLSETYNELLCKAYI
jgi:glycosyltransferase involved in cell wall biosynthesis